MTTKRKTDRWGGVRGVHTTPADALEAARQDAAQRIAALEEVNASLYNQRDEARMVIHKAYHELLQWAMDDQDSHLHVAFGLLSDYLATLGHPRGDTAK